MQKYLSDALALDAFKLLVPYASHAADFPSQILSTALILM
jgi:hypothetical protein